MNRMSIKWFTGGFFGDILSPTVRSPLWGRAAASEIVHERIFTSGSTHFCGLAKPVSPQWRESLQLFKKIFSERPCWQLTMGGA